MVSVYIVLSLVTISSSFMKILGSKEPTVVNYFLKNLDVLGRENWRYIMPNDTDIDQDGKVSDPEVEYKIHSYLSELFNIMDQDKDNIITEEEIKSPKFEISEFTEKVVDIALENFPVKPTLLAADANRDGFYDEDDFYLPAKLLQQRPKTIKPTTKARLRTRELSIILGLQMGLGGGQVPELLVWDVDDNAFIYKKIAMVGDNEGSVLCRSLGFEGLNRTIERQEEYIPWSHSSLSLVRLSCQGNESRLEDCHLINLVDEVSLEDEYGLEDEDGWEDEDDYWEDEDDNYEYKEPENVFVNYVSCKGEQKLGSLHLIGGKDGSAGDIFFGDNGLGEAPDKYLDRDPNFWSDFPEVVCRELGFPGFIKTTRGSAFTKKIKPDKYPWGDYEPVVQNGLLVAEVLQKYIYCVGTEEKIADCKITDVDWDSTTVMGIICQTDARKGVEEGLANIVGWNYDIWEKFGRFLFIADSNGDKKITLDEIAEKTKTYVSGILEFLDQTQDGDISIDDFTSLNIKVEPVQRILDLAFDIFANKDSDDIDPLALKIGDISLDELVGEYMEGHDENMDGKLNALDFFTNSGFVRRYSNYDSKERYLVTFLNMKLDKNQDGKLQRIEIKQFIDEMFHQLDTDKSGEMTLNDIYRLMRTHGFDCFQLGALKTFVTITLDTAKNQFGKFMSYLFKQFDLDSKEGVTLEEFQKMNVPCNIEEYPHGYDGNLYVCNFLKDVFFYGPLFGFDILKDVFFYGDGIYGIRFPDLEMKSKRRKRSDEEEDEETVMDKLANAACEILT